MFLLELYMGGGRHLGGSDRQKFWLQPCRWETGGKSDFFFKVCNWFLTYFPTFLSSTLKKFHFFTGTVIEQLLRAHVMVSSLTILVM